MTSPIPGTVDYASTITSLVNLVRTRTATTRPELGEASRLGRSIVTQRVAHAISLGLLEDAQLGPSTGGRSPRQLRFRSEQGQFLAVVFGALHVGTAVLDLDQNVLSQSHESWDITAGPESSLEFVAAALEKMLEASGSAPVWGVAVGVPGPVEFATGRLVAPPIMPGWNAFDIRGWLEARFGAPVFVDNDVNLMALGEVEVLGPASDDLLFLKVGSGIGAGLISGGRIHRGANGAAGDVGHIAVAGGADIVCRCGQIGCLEAIAGGWALARDGKAAASNGRSAFLANVLDERGFISPVNVAEGAIVGDALCAELIAKSGRTVGEMLATLVSVFNPSVVAVGGTIAAAGDLFLAVVRETVYRRSLPLATRDLRIVPASTDRREGITGAARLIASSIFHPESMSAWLTKGTPRDDLPAVYRHSVREPSQA